MKNLIIYGMVVAWFAAAGAVVMVFGVLRTSTLRPEQPIEFPHYIHVGELDMDCSYCHPYVEKSIYAGLPQAGLCMECHEGVATDRPEIIKLTEMYETGESVEWVRVYRVKPHVFFSHKRHVLSGVECRECHGPIELMTTVQRVTDLGMGWCMECHNERGAPIDCVTCHK